MVVEAQLKNKKMFLVETQPKKSYRLLRLNQK
jgi:hypothetical protein